MNDVVSEIIPIAIGIAASPFPIVPAILLLFTARPRAAGISFLLGWTTGILLATTLFELASAFIQAQDEPPAWASWTRIALGTALLILGLREWFQRGESKEPPSWMSSISEQSPSGAYRLGFVLSAANPKVLLLAAAGGLAIGSAQLPVSQAVAAILIFTAIAISTVLVPVLLYLVLGDRILPPLARVRDWLMANSAAVMAVVITVIGVLLLTMGVSGVR